MNINEIIIQNVNLLFNVEEFSEKFASIRVASLIDFFFKYNQMILIKKSRNLIIFIIFLKLL